MSRLRDNVGLLEDAAEFIQYARGPFGKMYTAEDVAGRILDAVDRVLATPSPETGTAAVPGSLWTTPAQPGAAGIKVDQSVTADDVRASVAAVADRAAAFAAPAPEPVKPPVATRPGPTLGGTVLSLQAPACVAASRRNRGVLALRDRARRQPARAHPSSRAREAGDVLLFPCARAAQRDARVRCDGRTWEAVPVRMERRPHPSSGG